MWGLLWTLTMGCDFIRATLVESYPTSYEPVALGVAEANTGPEAVFDGADASRPQLSVTLQAVATGFNQPTDIQFPPNDREHMLVLEKEGRAWLLQRDPQGAFSSRTALLTLTIPSDAEQGLLGAAFHPRFAENGRLFVHHTATTANGDSSRIAEWIITDPSAATWEITAGETILTLPQPYANHNAGQIAFGPDGFLFVGFGDGGWRDDPHEHGQNPQTWLGSMLRIDVDSRTESTAYAIPTDNPFVDDPDIPDETWAYGLRNPWRFSFDPMGRLIVADVGQNAWEEVSIVPRGGNMGWNHWEGSHCFRESCADIAPGTAPIYEYAHTEGQSITGGLVAQHGEGDVLSGKYIFGDFVSGRMWALDLPEVDSQAPATVHALGRWGMLISTFGRDSTGRLYVADFGTGTIYRMDGT